MAYSNIIDRTGSQALMPEEVSREIIKDVPKASAVLSLGRRLPNMTRAQRRLPVLSSLVSAYFVNGDTGLKQTTEAAWSNKYINAEEIAAIVPIPEAVLDDADYDIWGEIRPLIIEALGVVIDAAVLIGTNAPADWPDDLKTAATAASHSVDLSTQEAAGDDLYDIILGTGGLFGLVEADGYRVNGVVSGVTMEARLRSLRNANGDPIFLENMRESTAMRLAGRPINFMENGAVADSDALMFAGDWNQLVYAMRQDVTYKMLDQAVIQDGAGNIIYNLAQQDMVAMRVVMRMGWQVPNPIKRLNTNESTRFPFSVLVP